MWGSFNRMKGICFSTIKLHNNHRRFSIESSNQFHKTCVKMGLSNLISRELPLPAVGTLNVFNLKNYFQKLLSLVEEADLDLDNILLKTINTPILSRRSTTKIDLSYDMSRGAMYS